MTIREWRLQDLGAESQVLREGIVPEDGLEIGRTAMGMGCPDDPQMSARHARLFIRDGTAFVEELASTTGVWLRVRSGEGCALRVDDQIWLGAQILLIRKREGSWELRHHGPDGRLQEKHLLPDAGVFLGRTSDLVLDKDDSRLSRRHAQIVPDGEGLLLYDRGAHNGTFLKLVEPMPLRDGDEFRIATHRFRVTAIPEVAPMQAADPPEEATVLRPAPVRAPAASKVQDRAGAEGMEPPESSAAQTPETQNKKGGLAARLKRMGRPSESEPEPETDLVEETAPVEVQSDAASQEEVIEADLSEEATVLVFRDEPEPEPEPESEPERAVDVPPAEMLGETLPASTRLGDLPKAKAAAAQFEIIFETEGEAISIPAVDGQTVLEAVQAAGLSRGEPVDWECGDGGCGVCVVGLVGGGAGLEAPDPTGNEMKTIQITEQVTPDPESYRLACLARVRGNVRLRRL